MTDAAAIPDRVGPFRILGELGRGGQGAVYLAEDTRFPRRVALKVLSPLFSASPEMLARFRREAEVAARLAHPGICTVYEASFEGGEPWIAMRYVEGESLALRIEKERGHAPGGAPRRSRTTTGVKLPGPAATERGIRPEVAQILLFFEKAARAMDAAHEAGLVHRDLKPANVMVTPEGEPVILDFGLAHVEEIGGGARITQTGQLMGTPAYMAPEQLAAARIPLDRRTDVYSLAATLYECLTLRPAHAAPTLEKLFHRILFASPEDVQRHNPQVPGDLAVVLDTAMEKDRDRRYSTALEFAEDLRRVRTLEPIHARPAGPLLRLGRWARRNRLLAASLLSLFVVLAAGLAVSLSLLSSAVREKEAKVAALRDAQRERDAKTVALADAEAAKRKAEKAAAEARALGDAKDRALVEKEGALGEKEEALKRKEAAVAEAEAAHNAMEKASERSRALALVGASKISGEDDPMLGLLLAREAMRAAEIPEALSRLHEAVVQSLERRRFESPHHADLVRLSPDSDLVLMHAQEGTARLLDLDGRTKVVFHGHTEGVTSAAFSPDGGLVVTASADGTARVWTTDGKVKAIVDPKCGVLMEAQLSGDGRHVFLRDAKGFARVLDLAGKEILAAALPRECRCAFAPVGDRVAVLGDKEILLWAPFAKDPVRIPGVASQVAFSEDGASLALLTEEGIDVRAVDGRRVCLIPGYSTVTDCRIGFARDGSFVYAIGPERISSYDVPSGRARPPASLPRKLLFGPDLGAISPSGAFFLSQPYKGTPETGQDVLVRTAAGEQVARLVGDGAEVDGAAFTATGDRIVTWVRPDTNSPPWACRFQVWDLYGREIASYSAAPVLRTERDMAGEPAFSPSGDRVALPFSGQISVWDRAGAPVAAVPASDASGVFWAAGGDRLLTVGGGVRLWRLAGPAAPWGGWVRAAAGSAGVRMVPQAQLEWEATEVRQSWAAVSAGGDRILAVGAADACSSDGQQVVKDGEWPSTVVLLDAADGSERCTFHLEGSLVAAAILPEDRGVVIGTHSGREPFSSVRVYGLDGKAGREYPNPDGGLLIFAESPLRVSRDGRRVAFLGWAGLHVWDLAANESASMDRTMPSDHSVEFSPAGDRIVFASANEAVVVDAVTAKKLAVLKGHTGRVASAAFSPDGAMIVTGARDRTARLWDASDGHEIATLRAHPSAVRWAAFSPTGDAVLTSSGGVVHLWASRTGDLLALADTRITRSFTPEEAERFKDLLGEKSLAEVEAGPKVDALFDVYVTTAEVVKRLQADRKLAPAVKEAALALARARGDDPERLLAGWLARGEERLEQLSCDEALSAFRKAKALADPADLDALCRIHAGSAVALEKMGSDQEALHEYREALMVRQDRDVGRFAIELALRMGSYAWAEQGVAWARAAVGEDADPDFLAWCDRPRFFSELRRTAPRVPALAVEGVEEDSEAARAGVQKGDLLLRVRGRDVDEVAQVNRLWSGLEDEATCPIVVFRAGKEVELRARAGTLGLTLFRLLPEP